MYNKNQIELLFYKIYIKSNLTKKEFITESFLLDLIRDEIKLLVLHIVLKQVKLLIIRLKHRKIYSFANKETVDMIIKSILISSKCEILNILKITNSTFKDAVKTKTDYIPILLKIEEYKSLLLIFKTIVNYKSNNVTLQRVPIQMLIEHMILKCSSLLICDIFLTHRMTLNILSHYTIDSIKLLTYINAISFYLFWKLYFNTILPNTDWVVVEEYNILFFTKKGVTSKKVLFEKLHLNHNCSILNIILFRPVELIEYCIYSFIIFYTKR